MTKLRCEECGGELTDYGIDWMCAKCPVFTDKNYKWTDERKLQKLKTEMDLLESSRKRYYEVASEHQKLSEKIRLKKVQNTLSNLTFKTRFEECQYPAMGVEEAEGSAIFADQEQGDALIAALRAQASYYYAYVLHWSGSGEYRVIPEYRRDHDGETVYTANFIKKDA